MDLEGLMTPTHLFYVVQHFAVPQPVAPEHWRLTVDGACTSEITYEALRRLPARTYAPSWSALAAMPITLSIFRGGPEALYGVKKP